MASVNKVILIGNLGRDPDVRYMPNGDAVCNITIATSETWKDKNTGEKKEATEWHKVVMYRKLGEIAGQYLRKGSSVYIEGKLATRKWQDKDGNDRYTTEVVADTMQMLGGRAQGGDSEGSSQPARPAGVGSGGGAPARRPAPSSGSGFDDFEDDIPFASCAIEDDVIGRRLERRMKKGNR